MTPTAFAARASASAVLVSAAAAFLVSLGPRATPAHADIWGPLVGAAGFLPPPSGGASTLRAGAAAVNGQTFHYAVGRSRLPVSAVLDHFARQLAPAPGRRLAAPAGVGVDDEAGAVAGFRSGGLSHPDLIPKRLERFASTTRLADFGEFHVVAAYAQQGTVFIDFIAGPDVRLSTLLPAGSSDAPGTDLAGVRRPGRLQRLLTIDAADGGARGRTVVYRTPDAAASLAEYRTSLHAGGWTRNPLAPAGMDHFTDGTRECFIAGAGRGAGSALVVVTRPLARGHHETP